MPSGRDDFLRLRLEDTINYNLFCGQLIRDSLPTRCLSGAIPIHAGGVGDSSALHGADCGPVHEERACPRSV